MKTTHPNSTITFSPEASHALQALKFMRERTEPIFAKAASKLPEVKPKKRDPNLPTISFMVSRDWLDDEIELAVEVLGYEPRQQGGTWDEKIGPFITLGAAWTVPDGHYFKLTPLEREAAEEAAIKEIQGRPSYEEENFDVKGED